MPFCSANVDTGKKTSQKAMAVGVMTMSDTTLNSSFSNAACQRRGCTAMFGSGLVPMNHAILKS